ncbi:unnamed protein product [Allacma fusca]|uniref:Transmembrane protein n=1 Tax=Allacma fusca TaxID=39272 RepID=A0A8J2NMT9_9HEXA|nr:unnamed protein product [Allacma fusca]
MVWMDNGFFRHCVGGTLTSVGAVWMTSIVFFRYYKSLLLKQGSFKNSLRFHRNNRKPKPLYIFMAFPLVGTLMELYYAYPDWKTRSLHHLTIFVPFELLLVTVLMRIRKWRVPKGVEYLLFALSFSSEGILYYFHLERSSLDTTIHTHLCFIDVGIVLSTLLELTQPGSIFPALARCFFSITNGFQYYIAAEMLHPIFQDNYNEESHKVIRMIPVYFAWNMFFSLVVMIWIGRREYRNVLALKEAQIYQLITDDVHDLDAQKPLNEINP